MLVFMGHIVRVIYQHNGDGTAYWLPFQKRKKWNLDGALEIMHAFVPSSSKALQQRFLFSEGTFVLVWTGGKGIVW